MASISLPTREWRPTPASLPAAAQSSWRDARRRQRLGATCLRRTPDTAHGPSAQSGLRGVIDSTTSNKSADSSIGNRIHGAPTARAGGAELRIDREAHRDA